MASRILTTHVGSLPRPAKFIEVSQKRTLGEKFEEAAYEAELKNAVIDVVQKQKDAGVDLITTASSPTPWGGPTTTVRGGPM